MKWATPPKTRTKRPGQAYEKEAAELKANPGQWGIVKTRVLTEADGSRSAANDIKSGKIVAFRPRGSFDAESHKEWDEELGATVLNTYAVYLGEPGEH
jgi:hypothetical protein